MKTEELDSLLAEAEEILRADPEGAAALDMGASIENPEVRLKFYAENLEVLGETRSHREKYRQPQVDIETFLDDPEYMGETLSLWPGVRDGVVECINGEYSEAVWTGSLGCVDAETEFLSPFGWIRIADWSGHEILEWREDGTTAFVRPSYVEEPCEEFIHFRHKYGLDMMLSPEHRVPHWDKRCRNLKVLRADEVEALQFERACGFGGKIPCAFAPPKVSGISLSDPEIRLVAAICADGYLPPGNRGTVVNLKRDRKKNRLRGLLIACGLTWTEGPSSPDYTRFYFHFEHATKSLSFAWGANPSQLAVIADEILRWDGDGENIFRTCNRGNADAAQYALTSTGFRTRIITARHAGRSTEYVVRRSNKAWVGMIGSPKMAPTRVSPTDGRKYCFTTPSSYWVARRNGCVFVTGNSGKTTGAIAVLLYKLYEVMNLREPHRELGVDPNSEISFAFQSVQGRAAFTTGYMRFRAAVESSPWFRDNAHFDRNAKSVIRFEEHRVVVEALSGESTGAIGENIHSFLLDECLGRGSCVDIPGGVRNIEDVREGDAVLAWCESRNRVVEDKVVAARVTGIKPTVRIDFADGRSVRATANHPFLTSRGWVAAGDLRESDEVVDARAGKMEHGGARIVSARRLPPEEVWNLETERTHTFLSDGLVVHNCNHMKVTGQSAKTADAGIHDQAWENYRALARRRESRFTREDRVLGIACLCGSANFPGQFTDVKQEEARQQLLRDGKTSIFVSDKRAWEVQPAGRFSDETFRVFTGDGIARPRVLRDDEPAPDGRVVEVPDNYRSVFDSDVVGALKDVAGIATVTEGLFLPSASAVAAAFGERANVFDPDWCDFSSVPARIRRGKIEVPKEPRYVHIDLSLSMDSSGLAMGRLEGFDSIDRTEGLRETLPKIVIEGLLSIRPPGGGQQIPFAKIKGVIKALIEMGYPIRYVSLDSFQSADFVQTMRAWKITSGILSLDRKPGPYLVTRQAILDGRVSGPPSELARREIGALRWIPARGKVDHPPGGGKDLADCIAGVVYGLSSRRELWARHGVSTREIPESLRGARSEGGAE